jgi:hypothetical protein
MPIKLPTVGWHDVNTKEIILRDKGAVTYLPYAVFKNVKEVWPDSATYAIVNRYGETQGQLWFTPIDLGDNVKLSMETFCQMVQDQQGGTEYSRDDLIGYLKALLEADVELYKLMVKMGKWD